MSRNPQGEPRTVLREALVAALRGSILRRGDDREARWTAIAGDGLTPDEVMADVLLAALRARNEQRSLNDDPDYYPSTEYERGYADGRDAAALRAIESPAHPETAE